MPLTKGHALDHYKPYIIWEEIECVEQAAGCQRDRLLIRVTRITDCLFQPIYDALDSRLLSQVYGAMRSVFSEATGMRKAQQDEAQRCPVVEEDGKVCGEKLVFFLDPTDEHPVNPLVYAQARQKVGAAGGGRPGGA